MKQVKPPKNNENASRPTRTKGLKYVLRLSIYYRLVYRLKIGHNVLQLPEGGDFEALHCQPSRNFD
jgi:hypothetical protein